MKWFVSPTPRSSPRSHTTTLHAQGEQWWARVSPPVQSWWDAALQEERCFPQFCPGLKKKKKKGDFLCDKFYQTFFKWQGFFKTHVFVMCCPVAALLHTPALTFSLCQTHWFPLREWLKILHRNALGGFGICFCPDISSSSPFRNTIKSFSVIRQFCVSHSHPMQSAIQMEMKTNIPDKQVFSWV